MTLTKAVKLMSRTCSFYLRRAISSSSSRFTERESNTRSSAISEKETDYGLQLSSFIKMLVQNPCLNNLPEAKSWIAKMLEYNMTGGSFLRLRSFIQSYEMLEKAENITEETMRLVEIMGWCIEMIQAYMLIYDDMVDESLTRRGKPCWHRLPEVGRGALNDAIYILSAMYDVLKQFFEHKPYYIDILHLFRKTQALTCMGQYLDLQMQDAGKNDYKGFNTGQVETIANIKTTSIVFRLPLYSALLMTNKKDPEMLKLLDEVLIQKGIYYAMQNDYFDCFGDEKESGKTGNDITEGKCTWFAAKALERCSAAQRSVFTACYGSADPADVQRVKLLYEELRLPELYADEERRFCNKLKDTTGRWPESMTPLAKLIMKNYQLTFFKG